MTKYMPRQSGRGNAKATVFLRCPMHRKHHSVLFMSYHMATVMLQIPQPSLKLSQDQSSTDSSHWCREGQSVQ
jgi:hypothetical protein